MKNTNKILLYDDYCPLCTWYSGLFVKFGLLEPANRVGFSKAELPVLTAIDIEKGKDEIPLFDPATNHTLYGIDALLDILGQRVPLIRRVGNFRPVNWFLKKIYRLISYNRKVIVARKCGPGTYDCSPGFNYFYRFLFLLLFLCFNSLMLFPLHEHVFSQLSFYRLSISQLQSGHFAFVAINCLLAPFLDRKIAMEYLGQVNMLALLSVLLLTVLMFISFIVAFPDWLVLICMVGITVFIIKEYFRRMTYAGLFTQHRAIAWTNLLCLFIFLVYVFH